jgi:hypothetical protein
MNRFLPEVLRGGNQMRWMVAAVIAVLLLLGVGGVAVAHYRSGTTPVATASHKPSTCTDAYRLLSLRPSQIITAQSACLVQSLKFTGELAGAVAQGYTVSADNASPTSMCTEPKRWNAYPEALLAIVIGAKAYRLRISAPGGSEHQPLKINNLANLVELRAIKDPSSDWNQAIGTVTLNADGITGTVDASLLRDVAGAQPVHVTGKWACGAPVPLPAIDASVPCSNFYALNQLHDTDVVRMKAAACLAEDLTFSGGISAHVDHAITDSVSPHSGIDGDNYCAAVGKYFTASLKFSVGDESFLLDLNVFNYPAATPGQYSAETGLGAQGATLWLGHADPDNQGLFVADQKVFWVGSGGTFAIAPDMKSGTIDASLQGLVSNAGGGVQIKGSWRCAA